MSSNNSVKDETITFEQSIKVSLKNIQDYERELGKKIEEMNFFEKDELFKRITERDKKEANEKNTTYKITQTFKTTDPAIEYKRRERQAIKKMVIMNAKVAVGMFLFIAGGELIRLGKNEIFYVISGLVTAAIGIFTLNNTMTLTSRDEDKAESYSVEYNANDSQNRREGRSL